MISKRQSYAITIGLACILPMLASPVASAHTNTAATPEVSIQAASGINWDNVVGSYNSERECRFAQIGKLLPKPKIDFGFDFNGWRCVKTDKGAWVLEAV